MKLDFAKKQNGLLEFQFDAPHWRQGDKVIRHLRKRFKARVIDKAEGPDARTWTLDVQGTKIVVDQDDIGFLVVRATDASNDGLLTQIAVSVQEEVV